MLKKIQSVLFVVCMVMVFTAQTKRPDDQGQQHAPASRPAAHNTQNRPQQAQTRKAAPPPRVVQRSLPRVNIKILQPLDERRGTPRVYAVPVQPSVQNDRLFNRQHHNHWQPLFSFYNGQYNFYPYVNVTSPVELSADFVEVLFNGQAYYYDRGSYYVQTPQGYLAVPPPIGIIVNALPTWAKQINVDGQIYYRCKGAFYVQVPQGYQIVAPAPGVPDSQ